jgi:class 3 adenylate cyclase
MGDDVNIAARLEGIAEPGGICLSEDAYRQVRDRLQEESIDLGEKNSRTLRAQCGLMRSMASHQAHRQRRMPHT